MSKEKPFYSALSLSFELGYLIAIPIIAFALIGRLIDKRYDTSPWFLLVGIIVSIIVSTWIVYLKTTKILSGIEKEARESKNKDDKKS